MPTPVAAPRKLGPTLDGAAEPVAGIDRREFVRGELHERSAPVGGAIEQRVMMNDDDAVTREVDVELESISAKREAVVEGGEGVLGPQRRAASMRKYERPLCSGQDGHCSARRSGDPMVRCDMTSERPSTLAQLRSAVAGGAVPRRSVRDEVRDNLIAKLAIETRRCSPASSATTRSVVPQIVNAVLSRHNFILLGLRGPGEEPHPPRADAAARRVDPGRSRLRDPRRPAGAALLPRAARGCGEAATTLPIAWLSRDDALRREARDAGRDDRGHDRRSRSDQGGARRACSSPTS